MSRPPRRIREEGRVASAWAMSIVGHLVAVGLGGLIVASSLGRRTPPWARPAGPAPGEDVVEIELPTLVDGSLVAHALAPSEQPPEALTRGGGEGQPQLDTGRRGRGGTATAEDRAVNLADRDDEMRLSPEIRSRLDRDQIQRLLASKRRRSREDWRASREPMELTFLAEGPRGQGTRPERRRSAERDPSSGARASGAPHQAGGAVGAAALPPGFGQGPHQLGGPVEGAEHAAVGAGVRDGAPGDDHRDTARIPLARPMVNAATPSVPANEHGKPTDNVDAEQEVATAMQSILHASTAGGARGPGTGGQTAPGLAGVGGPSGPGSIARALGTGQGSALDDDPRDRRRSDYMRQIMRKLGPYTDWRKLLPVSAAVDGVQGIVTVTFTINADGSVAGASVSRASGVPELDENFRRAILRAAPYPALPPELGPTFRWAMPLDLRNPAVRPRTAKADPPTR